MKPVARVVAPAGGRAPGRPGGHQLTHLQCSPSLSIADHLHPNSAGYGQMANAIDIDTLVRDC